MNEQTILTATNLREYMQSVSYYEMKKKEEKKKEKSGHVNHEIEKLL